MLVYDTDGLAELIAPALKKPPAVTKQVEDMSVAELEEFERSIGLSVPYGEVLRRRSAGGWA